jgi:phosphatidylserine/phosphatidylglycerophosphate/cardiolipin synthase-like enzyme
MATHTEESLAALRGQIAAKLESSKQFEQEVSELILSVLRQERRVKNHGKILWHLMAKEPSADGVQHVVAKKAGVYLQYYIIGVLSSVKSRPFNRTLSSMELAWLTAIAHAGT